MLKYFNLLKISGQLRKRFTNFIAGDGISFTVNGDDVTIVNTGGTGGGGSSTETQTVIQASHGFTVGQWVGLNGNSYQLASATAGSSYEYIGRVSVVTDVNTFTLQRGGTFTDTNLLPNASLFLSDTTAGTIVGRAPETVGAISAPVAYAKTTTTAVINIGRPSIVASTNFIFGMNVGNDQQGSQTYQTAQNIADEALLSKNIANKRIRIALPSYDSANGITNMRTMALYYKSKGWFVSYGVTGRTGVMNTTTYNAWKAQIPTEAAWAFTNGIDRFYLGNEEGDAARQGLFGGGVTPTSVINDMRSISSTIKSSYPSMEVVYSDGEGMITQWGAVYPDFGALDKLGFNMYNTVAGFDAGVAFFQSQIGAKFFVSEWAANHPYYDMKQAPFNYTDAQYAADLATRYGVLANRGCEAYFFCLRYGGNTPISGNWNIYTDQNVFLPGALSAFGGGTGNAVKNTPIILSDNQKLYFTTVKTAYLDADSTDFRITAPEFGSLAISGRVKNYSHQTPQFRTGYDGSNEVQITVSSTGAATFNATGSGASFTFTDKVTIGNFNTILDGSTFSGADVAVKAMAAYASSIAAGFNSCIINFPAGVFVHATPGFFGVLGKRVSIRGTPGGGTEFQYTGGATNTTAWTCSTGEQNAGANHTSYEFMKDITLTGDARTKTAPKIGLAIGNQISNITWDNTVNGGTGTITGVNGFCQMTTGTPMTVTTAVTSDSVPTGLAKSTTYYLIRVSATTFRLASSLANANAGTSISTSSNGTGQVILQTGGYGGAHSVIRNVTVQGFGRNIFTGQHTYHFACYDVTSKDGGHLLYLDASSDSGEAMHFFNCFFADAYNTTFEATDAVYIYHSAASSILFNGCSFDDAQVSILQANNVTFVGNHFENPGSANWGAYYYVYIDPNVATNVSFNGDTFYATGTVGPTGYINNGGTVTLNSNVVRKFAGSAPTNFMTLTGSGRVSWTNLNTVSTPFTNVVSGIANVLSGFANASGAFYTLDNSGKPSFWGTITTPGTTGAQTINKTTGKVNFAIGATSLVVTNSLVTAASIVHPVIQSNDATMTSVQVVPTAGSFTIYANAAATAETIVAFKVEN